MLGVFVATGAQRSLALETVFTEEGCLAQHPVPSAGQPASKDVRREAKMDFLASTEGNGGNLSGVLCCDST